MSLFSFTYIHPHSGQRCTVDSGKPTKTEAFMDIVDYMRRTGLRRHAPKSLFQIKDETQRTVESSHGELTVDSGGNVLNRKLDNTDPDGGGHLAAIVLFNLREWQRYWRTSLPTAFDILDLGYWYIDAKTGRTSYVPPVADWRQSIAEILLERKTRKGGTNRRRRRRPRRRGTCAGIKPNSVDRTSVEP